MSESLIFAQQAALTLAWIAFICSLLSVAGMIFAGSESGRHHSEYQAIGWLIAAALLWLVAK